MPKNPMAFYKLPKINKDRKDGKVFKIKKKGTKGK